MNNAKKYAVLFCVVCLAVLGISAQPADLVKAQPADGIKAYPVPGFYNTPVTVVFAAENGRPLYAGLNNAKAVPMSSPVFLDVAPGEEREYVFSLFYAPSDPAGSPEFAGTFVYNLDRRVPHRVGYRCKKTNGRSSVWFDVVEPGVIMYSVYDPKTCAVRTGSVDAGKSDKFSQPKIDVPSDAVFSAFLVDRAGNKSLPLVVDLGLDVQYNDDFVILNPVPGTWENKQPLVIGNYSGTDVLYTLDGSDPRINGIVYEKPVLIDAQGQTQLRAVSRFGTSEKTVMFVTGSGTLPAELSCIQSDSVVTVNEFAELALPAASLYAFGSGAIPYLEGKTLSVASVPGADRYVPITVAFNGQTYRSVLFLNGRGSVGVQPAADVSPAVPMSGARYYAVTFPFGTSYSLDGGTWQTTDHPLFVSRSTPHELRWYNASYQKGEMQKLFLTGQSADIVLHGIPESGRSSGPVIIKQDNPNLELRYEIGFDRIPPLPTKDSPLLGDGIAVSAPLGDQFNCIIRASAFRDKYSDGDVIASFVVDRKIPVPPVAALSAPALWSRRPMTITWSSGTGDDAVIKSVCTQSEVPNPFSAVETLTAEAADLSVPDTNSSVDQYVIEGKSGCAVAYTSAAQAVDRSGNKSRSTVIRGIVERNAWYVSDVPFNQDTADGSPMHPYTSLDFALSQVVRYADNAQPCVIYVSGNHVVSGTYAFNHPVHIMSDRRAEKTAVVSFVDDAFITVAKSGALVMSRLSLTEKRADTQNAVIAVSGGAVTLDCCTLSSSLSKSILRGDSGTITVRNSTFNLSNISSSSALEFFNCTVDFFATDIMVDGTAFAQGLTVTGGSCSFNNGTIRVCAHESGGAALAVAVKNAVCKIDAAVFFVTADSAGRAIDTLSSQLFVTDSVFRYITKTARANKCGAVSIDKKSVLCRNTGNTVSGFTSFLSARESKR